MSNSVFDTQREKVLFLREKSVARFLSIQVFPATKH